MYYNEVSYGYNGRQDNELKRQDSALNVRQDNEHGTPGWCVGM